MFHVHLIYTDEHGFEDAAFRHIDDARKYVENLRAMKAYSSVIVHICTVGVDKTKSIETFPPTTDTPS